MAKRATAKSDEVTSVGGPAPSVSQTDAGTTLTYGALPKRATLVERLALPVIRDLRAITYVSEAVDHAVSDRKGALVVGVKGAGKTMALETVLEDFEAAEDERIALDAGSPRRQLVRMTAIRTDRRVDFIKSVFRAQAGAPMETLRRGKRIDDDELLEILIQELLNAEVAAIVVDEAEALTDEAVTVLRDIISKSEAMSTRRYVNGRYQPAGVGVVLLGTPELGVRLSASDEAGRRWLQVKQVNMLAPATAARVYRRFLPAFEQEARRRGDEEWVRFIHDHVCPKRIPVSSIENHVRMYVRRLTNHDPSIDAIEKVPFLEDVFISTHGELLSRSDGDGN